MFKHFKVPPATKAQPVSPYSRDVDVHNRERYMYLVDGVVPLAVRQGGGNRVKQWKQNVSRRYKVLRDAQGVDRVYSYRPAKEYCNHHRTVTMRNRGQGTYVLCPTELEACEIVRQDHITNGHDGHNRMESRLWEKYFIHDLRKLILANRKACVICNGHATHERKVIIAIVTTRSNELHMFDLSTMPMRDKNGYKHFILVKDHFDKFMFGAALKNKKKEPVRDFLRWLYSSGNAALPDRWGSDNGGEFINALMKQLVAELAPLVQSHGMPRHPQSQGLVEISNKTCKRKVVQRCQAKGYTVAGQEFDWTPHFFQHIEIENTQPLKLYREFTPFECRYFRPKMGAGYNTMEPADIDLMLKMMTARQRDAGEKLGHVENIVVYNSGDIVHVRCEDKHLKDKRAIAQWSARAIVHQGKVNNQHYYELRWLSQGFSDKECPGSLSKRFYICTRLKLIEPATEARVFDFVDGYCVETDTFDDGQSNYVFLEGEYQHKPYSMATADLHAAPSQSYSDHFGIARLQTEDDTSGEEDATSREDVGILHPQTEAEGTEATGPDTWGEPDDSDVEEESQFLCASQPQHNHDVAGWGDTHMADRVYNRDQHKKIASRKKRKQQNKKTGPKAATQHKQRDTNVHEVKKDSVPGQGKPQRARTQPGATKRRGRPLRPLSTPLRDRSPKEEVSSSSGDDFVAPRRTRPGTAAAKQPKRPRTRSVVSEDEEGHMQSGHETSSGSEDDTSNWRSNSPLVHPPTHCFDVGTAWMWSDLLCHWHTFLMCELTMMSHTFANFILPKAMRRTEYMKGLLHVFKHATSPSWQAETEAIKFLKATAPKTFNVLTDMLEHVVYASCNGWTGEYTRRVGMNLRGAAVPGSRCTCGVSSRVSSTHYLQIADNWYAHTRALKPP